MAEGDDPSPVRGKLAPAWATNLGARVAGRVGPQGAVAGGHALRPTPSETLVRAGLLPIVDGVLWVAADAKPGLWSSHTLPREHGIRGHDVGSPPDFFRSGEN